MTPRSDLAGEIVATRATLVLAEAGTAIECLSVDVGDDGVEIVSADSLQSDTKVDLVLPDRKIPLRIANQSASPVTGSARRFALRIADTTLDGREILNSLVGIQEAGDVRTATLRRAKINGVTVRAKRRATTGLVEAIVKTWGTRAEYSLAVEDLSRTGALLVGGDVLHLPFRNGTLLEIAFSSPLMPRGEMILSTAKVVRRADMIDQYGNRRCHIGIQLVELEAEGSRRWDDLILAVGGTPSFAAA